MSVSDFKGAKNQRWHKVIPQNNLNWSRKNKVLGRIPAQARNVLTHLHSNLLTINVKDSGFAVFSFNIKNVEKCLITLRCAR